MGVLSLPCGHCSAAGHGSDDTQASPGSKAWNEQFRLLCLYAGDMAAESETRRLLRARDAMDRGFAEPLSVAEVAQVAWMSPAHFTRRFHAVFGQTPHQYLYRRRIERAQWLLRTTTLSITEICHEVGYESLGTFTRTFRRLTSESPGQFRARDPAASVPSCFARAWREASSFGEAGQSEATIR